MPSSTRSQSTYATTNVNPFSDHAPSHELPRVAWADRDTVFLDLVDSGDPFAYGLQMASFLTSRNQFQAETESANKPI